MGFSRQEYWSGLPFPSLGHLPNSGIKSESLTSPALAGGFFTSRTLVRSHSRLLFFWTHQVSDNLQLDYFWFLPQTCCQWSYSPSEGRTGIKVQGVVFSSWKSLVTPRTNLKFQVYFLKHILLFNLFLAVLGLQCCVWAFSRSIEQGYSPIAVRGLLIAAASPVVEHRLQGACSGLSCRGAQAPGCVGSVVVSHGLSCPAVCGIFLDQGSNPCPLHWQAES